MGVTPLGPTQSIRNTWSDDYDLGNECENWFHPQCIVLKRNEKMNMSFWVAELKRKKRSM